MCILIAKRLAVIRAENNNKIILFENQTKNSKNSARDQIVLK